MKIYLVVQEDSLTMKTEILKCFTKLSKAIEYCDSFEEMHYDPEYDIWVEESGNDDWIMAIHIEEFQTDES